ncbi:MAG: CoA transferase [Gammaproteobacteria bacterium]|nr:CoA transferase [Gammaproteobacteria bacterium]
MDDDLPFAGLRVVDFSQGVAGPHCGMLFALNGADVVKIEPPAGDWGRGIGKRHGDFSAYNMSFNRGKRSLALDMKQAQGLAIAERLAADADVIIENNRPGVMARFGLDYEPVKAVNPDVIYVSVTGFGQSGPRSDLPATDSILQAFAGLMSANRDATGTPQRIGVLVIDVVTGLYAFQAASTALYRRATRGGGRHLSVTLMESIAAVQAGKMVEFALEGDAGTKPGAPVGTYETKDGFITINARRDSHWAAFAGMIGRAEWATDPRFATADARLENEPELTEAIVAAVRNRTTSDWAVELKANDILHAAVNDYQAYFDDEHVQQTESVQWVDHPAMGSVPIPHIPGLPPVRTDSHLAHSPALGAHSAQILRELGTSDEMIATLSAHNVVVLGG